MFEIIPTDLKKLPSLLMDTFVCDLVPFVVGPPGVAKTAMSRLLRKLIEEHTKEDWNYMETRLGNYTPPQLNGVFFPRESEEHGGTIAASLRSQIIPHRPNTLWFLDEITSAPKDMIPPAMELTLDHRVGVHELPDPTFVILAGNRPCDRAIAANLPAPQMNRLVTFVIDPNEDSLLAWFDWAATNGIDHRIIACLRMFPDVAYNFDGKRWDGGPFATYRSWEFVNRIITSAKRGNWTNLLEGTVGREAATIFLGFVEIAEQMPTIDAIKQSPESIHIPDDMKVQWMMTSALASAVREEKELDKFFFPFINRLPDEFSVFAMRLLTARKGADWIRDAKSSGFITWATEGPGKYITEHYV